MDKILKRYGGGKAFMDSSGNEMHLSQLTKNERIPFFEVE